MASCTPHLSTTVTFYPTICSNGVGELCIIVQCEDNYYNSIFDQLYFLLDGVPFANFTTDCGFINTYNFCTAVLTAGTHTWGIRVGNILCSDGGTFTIPLDYDGLPLNVSVLNQTNLTCTTLGSITALLTAWDIPSGIYVDLFRQSNLITPIQSVFIYTNSYTFPGLTADTYVIRLYRQYPPGHPQFGQKSTCYSEITVVITQSCILKATDCSQPAVVRYLDGTSYVSLIGTVMDGSINGKPGCWIIEEISSGTIDSTITNLITTYSSCDECQGTLCESILLTSSSVSDTCDQSIGSAMVVPTTGTGPYTYLWSTVPVQTTQTATGLVAGTYSVIVTDSLGCTGSAIVVVTNTCIRSYLIISCDGSVQSFVVTDPVTTPDPNPDTYVGFFNGDITLPSGSVFSGCFQMQSFAFPGVTGVSISVNSTFVSCVACLPPVCYKLTRCDDVNISFVVSTDLSSVVGTVITDINLACDTILCQHILPEQCWMVTQALDCTGAIILNGYGESLPNCKCCKYCPS